MQGSRPTALTSAAAGQSGQPAQPNAVSKGVRPVMWFDSASPLRSGWAWGQNYLEGGTTAFEATVGRGHVFAFGPEITFRGQPHGTFKFLFNGIYTAGQ